MSHNSFLNNFEDALIKLLVGNDVLKEYNWQRWDSDTQIELPRGYVELEQIRDVEHTPLNQVIITLRLEGRPKQQKLSAVEYELETLMCDTALCASLAALTNSVEYYDDAAEKVAIRRSLEGDLRKITFTCSLYAAPTV